LYQVYNPQEIRILNRQIKQQPKAAFFNNSKPHFHFNTCVLYSFLGTHFVYTRLVEV